jgi:hypothetical protein
LGPTGPTGPTGPPGPIAGSTTQVIYNNAGAAAGSANLTFNGTTLTANTVEARAGSGFRSFMDGSASISSQLYFANAANSRAWNWQLDASSNAALWQYDGTSWAQRFGVDSTSIRAPLFYDSNDTAFYLDPTSTSLALSSNGIVSSGTGTAGGFQNRTYVTGRNRIWSFGNADAYGISYFQNPDYIGLHFGTATQAASQFWVSTSGISQTSASSRAPLFYDSDNTAYYVDPASTSNINGLTVAATITGSISGNAATATNLSTNRTNWSTNGTITAVVGQLSWKNYGNSHTIFDASQSTAPDGSSVNNTNSQVAWTGTFPTLMGWNGANTYGVRVDSARVADSAGFVAGTNLGKTGSQGFFTTTGWTAADWANLAIGGGGMTIANTPGQPTTNYGFFIKVGNRDGGGPGWGGIWMDFSQGSLWYGNTVTSSSFASWYKTAAYGVNTGGNLYATIYYDNDDTAYYIDPASTSVVNQLNYTYLYYSANTAYGILGANAYFDTVNSGYAGDPLELCYARGSEVRIGYGGGVLPIKAGIYYDGDNTAYYCDPYGTSNLLSLSLASTNSILSMGGYTPSNYVMRMTPNLHINAYNGYAVIINWDQATTGGSQTFRVGNGAGADSFYVTGNGNVVASGNITAYSDERLKKDWADFPEDFVTQLASVKNGTYNRIDQTMRQVGVSAQSLRNLMPEAILEGVDEEKTLSVSYGNAALAACVELAKELVVLKAEIEELKSRIH